MEILIAIAGALIKGLFSVIGLSIDNKDKSDAAASKKALEGVIETTDAERTITEKVREVEREGVEIADIFAPELPDAGPLL